MNRYLRIFFLYSTCYAISVSQLEQLKKARKDITIALNQYNNIAQMESGQINAWKEKIQEYLAIIKQSDPHGAKELQDTMIDATFQAVDRIVEQKKALPKTPFLQKDTSKQATEKSINRDLTQSQNVAEKSAEKPIEVQKTQPQPTEKIISVESQKINAIKNEIERTIGLYRQSDDWYNVFEDLLQKVGTKDADAYRTRVPQRTVSKDIQRDTRGEMIPHDPLISSKSTTSSIKIVPVPSGQTKQVQSMNAPESKNINEPQSKDVIVQKVMEKPIDKPLDPVVIITPIKPSAQEQGTNSSRSVEKDLSEGEIIKNPQNPDSEQKQESSAAPLEKQSGKSSKSQKAKQQSRREKVASQRKTKVSVDKKKAIARKPTASKSVVITPVIEKEVREVKSPSEKSGSEAKTGGLVNETAGSSETKQESKPLEPSETIEKFGQQDDDFDFSTDINSV